MINDQSVLQGIPDNVTISDLSLHFHGEPSDTALIILRLFRCGMMGLEESYGDYILITFKEV